MNALIAFSPDSALVLVIALIGLFVTIGVVKPRRAGSLLGLLVLGVIAGPFLAVVLDAIPLTWLLLVMAGIGLWATRTFLTLLLGREGAGHVIGVAFVGAVKLVVWVLVIPLRLVGYVASHATGPRR